MGRSAVRVRKRAEYLHIQAKGRRVSTPRFVLLLYARWASGLVCERARLGVTVSRRVGNAVVRNRLKRLIREAFGKTPDLWADDIDLVVIVKSPAPTEIRLGSVVSEWVRAAPRIRKATQLTRLDRQKRQSLLADRG